MQKSLPFVLPSQVISLSFAVLSFLAFTVPFSLGHPQILVGTIVNACLFSAALYLPSKLLYSLIFLPSLGVLSRGLIFGPLTPFLTLMLPFIWSANLFLVKVFRKFYSFGFAVSALLAVVLKTVFLFSTAFILVKAKLLPKPFLISMGQLQLITALFGASLSFIIQKIHGNHS